MKADILRTKIKHSIANQQIPLMVNATCGTTILGAFDPLDQIADVCEEFGMWLHVDVRSNKDMQSKLLSTPFLIY